MTTSVNNFLRIHSTTLECSVAYSNRKREKKVDWVTRDYVWQVWKIKKKKKKMGKEMKNSDNSSRINLIILLLNRNFLFLYKHTISLNCSYRMHTYNVQTVLIYKNLFEICFPCNRLWQNEYHSHHSHHIINRIRVHLLLDQIFFFIFFSLPFLHLSFSFTFPPHFIHMKR